MDTLIEKVKRLFTAKPVETPRQRMVANGAVLIYDQSLTQADLLAAINSLKRRVLKGETS